MTKSNRRNISFIPVAYSFSEFETDENGDYQFGDSDYESEMYSRLGANMFVASVLSTLDDKRKIVFMFLLLRELGYDYTHEDCANILSISRQAYAKLVKSVRLRADKILQGNRI